MGKRARQQRAKQLRLENAEPERLFVYGTLRTGEGLARWLPADEREFATISGRLYHVTSYGGYPVCDTTETGNVRGEIVTVPARRQRDLDQTLRMETGAGYAIRTVPATTDAGQTIDVLVCHWPHRDRGPRIESGDWIVARWEAIRAGCWECGQSTVGNGWNGLCDPCAARFHAFEGESSGDGEIWDESWLDDDTIEHDPDSCCYECGQPVGGLGVLCGECARDDAIIESVFGKV